MGSDQKNIKTADDFILNFMVEQMVNMTEEIHNMKEGCKGSFEHLAHGMQDNFDRLSREIKTETAKQSSPTAAQAQQPQPTA